MLQLSPFPQLSRRIYTEGLQGAEVAAAKEQGTK